MSDQLPDYDIDKIDEVALALLYLTLSDDNRAWKGMAFSVSNRLFEKGYITDPRNKNKSLLLTPDGVEACKRLFEKYFSIEPDE